MDDVVKPQDADANESGEPVVNDITPPPTPDIPEETQGNSQPINVIVETGEGPESTPESVAAELKETFEKAEQSTGEDNAPLATPPAEESSAPPDVIQLAKDEMAAENSPGQPLPEAQATTQNDSLAFAPEAAMGVAASQMQNKQHPHRNNKRLAVIVTVTIALLLSTTAVFVYLSADSNTQESLDNSSPTQQDTSAPSPSPEIVPSSSVPPAANQIDATVDPADSAADNLSETDEVSQPSENSESVDPVIQEAPLQPTPELQ